MKTKIILAGGSGFLEVLFLITLPREEWKPSSLPETPSNGGI